MAERPGEMRPHGNRPDARLGVDLEAPQPRDMRPVPRIHRSRDEPADPLAVRLERPGDVRRAVAGVHPPAIDDIVTAGPWASGRVGIAANDESRTGMRRGA